MDKKMKLAVKRMRNEIKNQICYLDDPRQSNCGTQTIHKLKLFEIKHSP